MPTVSVRDASDRLRREVEPQLSEIFASATTLGDLTLSRLCAHVLLECVRYLPSKKSERRILSTSTVFLITLLLARDLRSSGQNAGGSLMEDDVERLRAWGRIIAEKHSGALDKMAAEFFSELPAPDTIEFNENLKADLFRGIGLGKGFERTIRALAELPEIRITDIVLRSIDDPQSGIAARISKHDLAPLVEDLRQAVKIRAGRIPEMVREAADDELVLGVGNYAKAIATVLRTARDEFTFALFGPWGSGKTTLVRLLRPLLEDPAFFRKETNAENKPFSQQRYDVVLHNAWKYRDPPEAWIYLYKSLVDRAGTRLGTLGRYTLAARTAYYRRGPWPLVGALLSIALLAIPLDATLQLGAILGSLIGVAALAHLAAISPKVQTKIRAMFEKHARLSSSPDSLGMLALVGEDIHALILAWTEPHSVDRKKRAGLPIAALTLPIVVVGSVAAGWASSLTWTSHSPKNGVLINVVEFMAGYLPKGLFGRISELLSGPVSHVGGTVDWAVLVIWCLLAFVTMVVPWFVTGERPNRVLLIVDDLDRCPPDEMLSVVENLKLLVDDKSINDRLQVMMLVDESVLAHAIARRYKDLIVERAREMPGVTETVADYLARHDIVVEQNEKLFACHLRFPAIDDNDVAALVRALSSRELKTLREMEQQRRSSRRQAMLQQVEIQAEAAREAQRRAEETVQDILNGRKRDLIDVNAPSAKQPPRATLRMPGGEGMIDAVIEATPEEIRSRTQRNAGIEEWNRSVSAATPDERIAQNPDSVRRVQETSAQAKQLDERLARMRTLETDNLSDDDRAELESGSPPFVASDVRFTPEEVGELERLVPRHFRTIGRRPSPRAIRTLLFKIQLCRLLMQLTSTNPPLEGFSILAILDAFERAALNTDLTEGNSQVAGIAGQVI
ncbi:hypothetical protein HFN53_04750 [Rhizobium leguminosarum]|nr:hypothetical protein [Rhizobium leguminosarum]